MPDPSAHQQPDPAAATIRPFQSSVDGFRFVNSFPGVPLPFRLPRLPGLSKSIYGLCGGMCFTVLDFQHAGKPLPDLDRVPEPGSRLHRYLFWRQMASFGTLGAYILRFIYWMFLPEDTARGTWKRTYDHAQSVFERLARGERVVLGIEYVGIRDTLIPWKNHQVLAHGCSEISPDVWDIHVYDPNLPRNDSVVIRAMRVTVGARRGNSGIEEPIYGLRCLQKSKHSPDTKVRGFFPVAYRSRTPPEVRISG
jgi:hypothetical protein